MDAETKGYRMGWADAEGYARGGKRERALVRRRLARSYAAAHGEAPFWTAYRAALKPRAEAFGDAIRDGRLPRTIRPSKLFALVNR